MYLVCQEENCLLVSGLLRCQPGAFYPMPLFGRPNRRINESTRGSCRVLPRNTLEHTQVGKWLSLPLICSLQRNYLRCSSSTCAFCASNLSCNTTSILLLCVAWRVQRDRISREMSGVYGVLVFVCVVSSRSTSVNTAWRAVSQIFHFFPERKIWK